jgi:hypothetical protein
VIAVYQGGKGRLPHELTPALLCADMGWTIQEYRAQPDWFIDDLLLIRTGRNEQIKQANR